MYCPKCGDIIEKGETYCNKCGTYLPKNNNKKITLIVTMLVLGIVLLISGFILVYQNNIDTYYFSEDVYSDDNVSLDSSNTSSKKSKYSTVIVYDNTYSGMEINNDKDAYDLIVKDSVNQKDSCSSEIIDIENNIISKYGITAVNLCEMNVDFARELGNVFKKIYDEYPSVRGYITNLTLVNASMSDNYIAAFMPAFNFATSDSKSTYPWVIKTQVLLNTSYFLNTERLETSVTDGSNSGHFPPNATIYSPIAHELGHYLSFLAMMKSYKLDSILLIDNENLNTFYSLYSDFGEGNYSLTMINEAYEKYRRDTNTKLTLDEWRGTISQYALAKDNSGEYIYDETIAEAFHDVYLNDEGAKDASKYIVSILKEKLGS